VYACTPQLSSPTEAAYAAIPQNLPTPPRIAHRD
jgi:hypothetical protein